MESSEPSGSDFGDEREAKLRKRAFRQSRGKSVSDTEEEDLEGEDDLVGELVSDDAFRSGHVRRQSPSSTRLTAEQKGKRPMSNEDDEREESDETTGLMHGPLSKEAVKEALALGKATRQSAEAIAKKYGKSARAVMIAAGLGIQNAREPNFSNQYKVWYAHHHPKPKDGKSSISLTNCLR